MLVFRKLYFVLYIFLSNILQGATIGNDVSGSRPGFTQFPFTDTNIALGLANFSSGFFLGNAAAVCTFNDVFPVSGIIDLRGGTLILSQDFIADSLGSFISTGTIIGNMHVFSLPALNGDLNFPTTNNPLQVNAMQFGNTTANNSVDWAITNTGLGLGGSFVTSISNFRALNFNGLKMHTDASLVNPTAINCVRWHPTLFYLAFAQGTGSGGELQVFRSNTGTLTQTGTIDFGAANGVAVAWHPGGLFLVGGSSAAATGLRLHSFNTSTGALTAISTSATTGAIQNRAMDWEANGNYIVVGTSVTPQLQTYLFNGSTTLTASVTSAVGNVVNTVSCSSLAGNYIAVGSSSGTQNLRVYQHNIGGNSLTELTAARVGETNNVLSVDWSPDGTKLAVGLSSTASTNNFRIYSFNPSTFTLTLLAYASHPANINEVRWSRDGNYITVADANTSAVQNLIVYSLSSTPFVLQNVNVVLNANTILTQPLVFQGYCTLQGNGNNLDLSSITSFSIDPTSTLILNNVTLSGISGTKINGAADSSLLILKDATWIQNNNAQFSKGAIQITNTNSFQGPWVFAYQSSQPCTLLSRSSLLLDQDFTFSYDPINSVSQDLISFVDSTSQLILNGSTLYAATNGLTLKKGSIVIRDNCTMKNEIKANGPNNGITFGNNNPLDDIAVTITSASQLLLSSGSINYKNSSSSSWRMANSSSQLTFGEGTALKLYQSLNLGSGIAQFLNNSSLIRFLPARLMGSYTSSGTINIVNL